MIRFFICALTLAANGAANASTSPPVQSRGGLAAQLLTSEASIEKQSSAALKAPTRRELNPALDRRSPLVRVIHANRSATREPDSQYYLGAGQIYPWSEGSLYQLYAAPEQISDIALQAGEALVSVAAGDTARWVIGDTSSGSGSGRRVHILVKPAAAGLRTSLVIATDRRIYHIEAISTPRIAMASLSWIYPQDDMNIIRASPATSEMTVVLALAVESLNFGYRIEGAAAWRPVRAFDDGHQTFIQFPPTLADGEAPPLFVTGTNGGAELVNYRVKGHFYVVDRLFDAAELRLGGKHQQIVRIIRDEVRREGRRPS